MWELDLKTWGTEVDLRGALAGGEWVSTVKSREPLGRGRGVTVLQKAISMLLSLKGSEIGHLEAGPGLRVDGLIFVSPLSSSLG